MELIFGVGIIVVAVLFALYLIGIAVEHPGENGVLAFLLIIGGGTICCLFVIGYDLMGEAYRADKVKSKEDDQVATMGLKEATAITAPITSKEETTLAVAEDDTAEAEKE